MKSKGEEINPHQITVSLLCAELYAPRILVHPSIPYGKLQRANYFARKQVERMLMKCYYIMYNRLSFDTILSFKKIFK